MKTKTSVIPTYTTESFRKRYFQGDSAWSEESIRASVAHFEIHRRDDFRFRCQQTIASNRLDFYMVILITGGEGIHTFGVNEYYLKPGMLCFVSPGMITSWQTTVDEHAGYFCAFTSDFFQENLKDQQTLASYPFFSIEGSSALYLDETQTQYFSNFFREIEGEYHSQKPHKADLIRAFLTVILQKAQRMMVCDPEQCLNDQSTAGLRLTKAFTKLFEQDFEPLKQLQPIQTETLASYAAKLNVTQNHLNDTIKAVAGKTPGELIRERTLKEASQLLLNTQLSVAEICFLLKFEDPSYFSRFFKRYTNRTPKQHREKAH
ncbi:AraC family transcriptional regulator [Siphonobacter sp.]|uniref:AraC family transcriptional regulator n=1 Tax=Siphonobacter sp. TaxID=1869184 RepID=UPI003B3B9922